MIKILRVDERLVHGQVAVTWVNAVGADCILLAIDKLDPIVRTTVKLSTPAGVKLVIKTVDDAIAAINSGKTDPYHLFVLVENVTDAYRLVKGCKVFHAINIGRTKRYPDSIDLTKEVHVSARQREMLRELTEEGCNIELQMIPSIRAVPVRKLLG